MIKAVVIIGSVDNMEFIKQSNEALVGREIANRLNHLTARRRVLWLVPGGSAARVASLASRQLKHPENLIVSLTDERFGPPGHNQSNWQLLKDSGFDFPLHSHGVLVNRTIEDTLKTYNNFLAGARQQPIYTVGLIGMGPDGHIAGILPNSPAVNSRAWAVYYQAPDFMRLTVTGRLVAALDEVFVYAVGAAKHPQIKKLAKEIPASGQPAQLLKRVARVRFFNDLL